MALLPHPGRLLTEKQFGLRGEHLCGENGPQRPIRGAEQGWAANLTLRVARAPPACGDHRAPEPSILTRGLAGGRRASTRRPAGETRGGEQVF